MKQKTLRPPKPPTLEEAAKNLAQAWCDWHNDPDKMLSPELVDACWGMLTPIGLMMNENPKTGEWELVRL